MAAVSGPDAFFAFALRRRLAVSLVDLRDGVEPGVDEAAEAGLAVA